MLILLNIFKLFIFPSFFQFHHFYNFELVLLNNCNFNEGEAADCQNYSLVFFFFFFLKALLAVA